MSSASRTEPRQAHDGRAVLFAALPAAAFAAAAFAGGLLTAPALALFGGAAAAGYALSGST